MRKLGDTAAQGVGGSNVCESSSQHEKLFDWSEAIQTHCKTTEFGRCPTGGKMVAGSDPISPTQVRDHFGLQKLASGRFDQRLQPIAAVGRPLLTEIERYPANLIT